MKCDWLEPGASLSSRTGPKRARILKTRRPLAPSGPSLQTEDGASCSYSDDAACESNESKTSPPSIGFVPSSCQVEMHTLPSPQSALSTSHIPLSNSLKLTADDQAAFLYIPDSILVLSYGKPWKWSCFSYIYTHVASQYSGVMRSFIAVAAMELRSRELIAARDSNDSLYFLKRAQRLGDSAAAHYSLALKDLSSLLGHVCQSEVRSNDIDALFVMWCLILRFEAHDSDSTGASLVHLDGIRSFLRPYLESGGHSNKEELPYISQLMLLYTL